MLRSSILLSCAAMLALPAWSSAQQVGTFRWQLQPYCNVLTVVVTQVGSVYRVEGTDDQCGAATSASVIGTAFQNPNGSIGFGLNVVAAPGGIAAPIDATIALATLSGTWRDSGGGSGTFAFTLAPAPAAVRARRRRRRCRPPSGCSPTAGWWPVDSSTSARSRLSEPAPG